MRPADPIPVNDLRRHNGPLLAELEKAARSVLASGWYILGSQVKAFESEFAAFCGAEHAVGVGNGTDALELALRALEIGPGDRVATVANAGGYSSAAIRAAGAGPLYVEVAADSMLMDPGALAAAGIAGVRAVIATHLYGRMVDMPRLLAVTAPAGIPVIEDCAQAHGARLAGKRAGSWGTLGCFSFYPTKNLGALGDGGAVVTADSALAERVRRLRQYGWASRYRNGPQPGRNSRLDELQAALLRVKLPHLDEWNERRRAVARAYTASLRDLALTLPEEGGESSVAHLYVVRSPRREAVRNALAGAGIGTDVHYPIPDHRQACAAREAPELPVTEGCCREVLTLPCFAELTGGEIERVAGAVRAALAGDHDAH